MSRKNPYQNINQVFNKCLLYSRNCSDTGDYPGRDAPIHDTWYRKAHVWQIDASRMSQNSYVVAANAT